MYRRPAGGQIEFLLVHPGGPFFLDKDEGSWTIPKGEAAPGEDLLARARMEFAEEVGFEPDGAFFPLGEIQQKGGKRVHAWAMEGDLPPVLRFAPTPSNWSGRRVREAVAHFRKLIARSFSRCPAPAARLTQPRSHFSIGW
jgi:predicted NUDIX family NTP pyrophosphohydrolase